MENLKFNPDKVLKDIDNIINTAQQIKEEVKKYKQWTTVTEAEEIAPETEKTLKVQKSAKQAKPKRFGYEYSVYENGSNTPPEFII